MKGNPRMEQMFRWEVTLELGEVVEALFRFNGNDPARWGEHYRRMAERLDEAADYLRASADEYERIHGDLT